MSILGALGKIVGIGAAPFTGGASLALTGLGAVGDILGKHQAGAAQGAAQGAALGQAQDRNAIDLYQAQQGAQNQAAQLDLDRKAYGSKHQSTAFKEALIAQLLGNYTPSSVNVPGIKAATMSGGMGAALQNPGVLELLKKIAATQEGNATTPLQYEGGNLLKAPNLTPLPKQGGGSKLLDSIARIAQIAGPIAGGLGQQPQLPGTQIKIGGR